MRYCALTNSFGLASTAALLVAATALTSRADAPQAPLPQSVAHSAVLQPPEPEPEPSTSRLVWNPAWPRFRSIGYALTGASVAGALAATFLIPYPDDPHWVGGILSDTEIRHMLRVRSPATRDAIRLASDVMLATSVVQTGLVDGFLLPALDNNWNVLWQLTLMNAQAFALNTLVATLLFKAVARARPIYAQCRGNRDFDPLCDTGSFASFPSSHASTTFTAAGLTCVHHKYLPLWGGQPWDTAACAGSIAIATATSLFRVVGDRHYFSDVLLGAAFGFTLGYLYPYLFHYQYSERDLPPPDTAMWGIVPGAERSPYGLSLVGQF